MFDSASIFLVHVLQIPDAWMLDPTGTSAGRNYGTVPWAGSSSSASRKKPVSFANQTKHRPVTTSTSGGQLDESNEVGMTNERQADLRAKIYTMLGDRGSVATAAANATNNSSSTGTAKDIKKSSIPSSGVSSTAGILFKQPSLSN